MPKGALGHLSLWSLKMFLDLWNFCCLILASEVLLFLAVFHHGGCRLVSYLISYISGKYFTQFQTCLKKSRPDPGTCTRSDILWSSAILHLSSSFFWPIHAGLPWEGESLSSCCLASVSMLEQSFRRSGSGCMHAKGDIRALFHILAFAKTLSVLVSNLEERELMISH